MVASLRARLDLEHRRRRDLTLDDIIERFQQLPALDGRKPEDIIGYDKHGLPS